MNEHSEDDDKGKTLEGKGAPVIDNPTIVITVAPDGQAQVMTVLDPIRTSKVLSKVLAKVLERVQPAPDVVGKN